MWIHTDTSTSSKSGTPALIAWHQKRDQEKDGAGAETHHLKLKAMALENRYGGGAENTATIACKAQPKHTLATLKYTGLRRIQDCVWIFPRHRPLTCPMLPKLQARNGCHGLTGTALCHSQITWPCTPRRVWPAAVSWIYVKPREARGFNAHDCIYPSVLGWKMLNFQNHRQHARPTPWLKLIQEGLLICSTPYGVPTVKHYYYCTNTYSKTLLLFHKYLQ
jgi:hypothetical protein